MAIQKMRPRDEHHTWSDGDQPENRTALRRITIAPVRPNITSFKNGACVTKVHASILIRKAAWNSLPDSTTRKPSPLVRALVRAVIGSSATKSLPLGAKTCAYL